MATGCSMAIEISCWDIKYVCWCVFLCRMMGVHGVKLMWRIMEESMLINVWWYVCVGIVRVTGCHKWTDTHFAWGTFRIKECEVNLCAVIMKCLLFSSLLWSSLIKGAWVQWFGKYLCERGMLYGIIDAVCLHLHLKLKQLVINFQGVVVV